MKIDGTEDLRVQKTMDAIHTTFEAMICEMDYGKITVKELCERARINKKTFYRYYPTLDDLLAEVQEDFSHEYIERTRSLRIPEDIEQITREFCLYSAAQGEAYDKITCSGSYLPIRQQMIDHVMADRADEDGAQPDDYERNLLLAYMHGCTLRIYCRWVEDGRRIPVERMADIACDLICRGVEGYLKA